MMCATCGCGGDSKTTLVNLQTGETANVTALAVEEHGHWHAGGTYHPHAHAQAHGHDHSHSHDHHGHRHQEPGATLDLQARILARNDALAAQNRAWFAGRDIVALNLVSSPGAGKTTLLERTIAELAGKMPLFVIEGDQATANDAERVRAAGAPAVQVNTGSGCHLDAQMVRQGLVELKPAPSSVVLIENVGNLVCPALFDLGERAKVAIFSVTEGEDKPLKYPHMFRASSLVLLNKIDLLPHLDFSLAAATDNIRRVNAEVEIIALSARSGEGFEAWLGWLARCTETARDVAW